jgi:ADP-ribose pyrophosphatase YjhB (NUDIX family)
MEFQELFKYCPVCGSHEFVTNNVKSKKCLQCGFVYYLNPSSATAAFITNAAGELLVCRRGHEPAKNTLDLPGGFVDAGETGEEGIAREIQEELGAEIAELRYLFSLPNEYLYSNLTEPTLDMFFEATLLDYSVIKAEDDVAECFFLPLHKINPQDFGLKSVRRAVEKFLNEKEK